MKILVIGLGSIGQRHRSLLQQRPGLTVECFSQHLPGPWTQLPEALEAFQPDIVVVSNRTEQHLATLELLEKHILARTILVEKPLFAGLEALGSEPKNRVYVAYNFRYHPVIQALKSRVDNQSVRYVHVFCGSYLPDWRPGRDYRSCYSASRSQGGGVLRDLSHEIDYCLWLFGPVDSLVAIQDRVSNLEIQSEDTIEVLARLCSGGILHLHLDYLCSPAVRRGLVQMDNITLNFDLISNRLSGPEGEQEWECRRNDTYQREHSDLLGDQTLLCTYSEALQVQKLIAAVERSAQRKEWVKV